MYLKTRIVVESLVLLDVQLPLLGASAFSLWQAQNRKAPIHCSHRSLTLGVIIASVSSYMTLLEQTRPPLHCPCPWNAKALAYGLFASTAVLFSLHPRAAFTMEPPWPKLSNSRPIDLKDCPLLLESNTRWFVLLFQLG